MEHRNWTCPKCSRREFEVSEVRTEGGALSAMFDVSTNRFSALTCASCSYTEFYRTRAHGIDQVLDFMVG